MCLRTIHAAVLMVATLLPQPAPVTSKYDRYKLFELVARADVIVTGTIQTIASDPASSWIDRALGRDVPRVFALTLETPIVGGSLPNPLSVGCFEDWTCASRWTSYKKGQRVLLFLARPAEKSSVYTILGGGGEGEMPLAGDSICVRGYSVRGYESKEHAVGRATAEGSLIALTEFTSAIRAFRETYSWEVGPRGSQIGSIRLREGLASAESFARSSRTAQHLHEEASSSPEWRAEVSQSLPELFPRGTRKLSANANGFSGPVRLGPGREPDRFGFEVYSGFGRAMTYLGDVDGDGAEDMAVGAPTDSFLGHFHGAAWILFLASDGSLRRATELREGLNGFPEAMNEFSSLGESLAPLGDLDGNGVPDLAIGASHWNGGEEYRGGVWILSLAKDGSIARATEIGSDPKLKAAGVKSGSGLGCSLANIGDIDGDGLPEIAIGQDPEFEMGFDEGRGVYLVSLDATASLRWARRLHDRSEGFTSDHSWLGQAIAGAGDVDGDGVRDLAVANPYDADGGEIRGAVWVVFLKSDGSIKAKQKISDWQGGFEGALHDGSSFGEALCGPGDVDGDGIPDLLASSSEGVWTLFLRRDGNVGSHVLTAAGSVEDPNRDRIGISIASRGGRGADGIHVAVSGAPGHDARTSNSTIWFVRLGPKGAFASW